MRRALVIGALLVSAFTARARTYYVAPNGNNVSSGTIGAPLRTITHAAEIAAPGDVVIVRGGVYYEPVAIGCRGTAAARIVFRPQAGEKAVIDGSGNATPHASNLVSIAGAAFVDFTGFEVRYAKAIGISLWGSHDIRIARNTVHDSRRNGIYAGYDKYGVSANIIVDGNDVYENVLENKNHEFQHGGWSSGLAIGFTEGGQITNNRVHLNYGEGLGTGLSNHFLIEGNVSFDNFSMNIYIDNSRFVTINRNFIYNTGLERMARYGLPAVGIGMANEEWSTSNPLSDNRITNNIVVNTRAGFYYGNFEKGGGLKNTLIANNTFYKSGHPMLLIERDRHAGNVVQNNIFYQAGSAATSLVQGGGVTYRNNCWFGAPHDPQTSGPGDVNADPRLAHPGTYDPNGYRLTASSPLLRKGAPAAGVTNDFFGSARGATPDIGAHQLSGR